MVDFRKEIRLSTLDSSTNTLCCDFGKSGVALLVNYLLFDGLVLSWVI